MAGSKEWALELDAEWAKTEASIRDAVITIATEGLALLQEHSPVGNPSLWKRPVQGYVGGQFRANWLSSIGAPSGVTVPFPGGDLGPQGLANIFAYPAQGYPAIYLQNNLPYALALEHGHSTQAPAGVVAITIPELEAFMARVEI